MQKILTIARREYQAMVATKAFIVGMAMMPILMLGGMIIPKLLRGIEKAEDRRIAVIDHTGQLFLPLKMAADQRNLMLKAESSEDKKEATEAQPADGKAAEEKAADGQPKMSSEDREEREAKKAMGMEEIHRYVLEQIPSEGFNDEKRLELSEQIRDRKLYAFIEIPAEVLTAATPDLSQPDKLNPDSLKLPEISYVAEDAALADAKRWAETSLNQMIRAHRLSTSVSPIELPKVMIELERRASVRGGGLFYRDADGKIVSKEKPNELAVIFLPMGIMMLMFMIIMMSAQPMLESVLEEKTLRISEVLLGSANAQQLMTGKLLGNVGGSITVFALYAVGGLAFANYQGYGESIPYTIVPWFIIYQVLAVLMFSSVFMAIAACVSQLREAQSLLLPVWMVMMLPLMVWFNAVREPNSTLATTLSFFPPSTPLMMTLRLATGATIPAWQILLSIVILLAGTAIGVIAAARIYRIGILWQGKPPKINELIGWLVKNPN